MIKTKDLTYIYEDGTRALDNINVDLNKGNIIGIIGANGSGKTTLFLNLVGLLKPTSGKVLFDDNQISYKKKELIKLRKKIGVVFQDPDKQIFYPKVYDDVAFGLRNLGYDEREVKGRVEKALESVDAKDFKDKPVHFLSYGQKKRVAIAGVLALDNDIIFFDEPTAGLDPIMTKGIIDIIKSISEKGKKVVISSHDMDLIYKLCDYAYILNSGKVISSDNVEKVFLDDSIVKQAKIEAPWLIRFHKNVGGPIFKREKELYKFLNERI
ncbi:energy-coupling factor ABC transporter ATP-binding protein [Dethiothermospora halolimnae]|uniref:energy-coupling factor ABC transporter ATP-binding protein n=1 Tax=Dethiothermospora halolimnae TaxID=3114390 RepID=UPI003CCB94A1